MVFYCTWKEIMPTCKPGTNYFSLFTDWAEWVTIQQVKANGSAHTSTPPFPQVLFPPDSLFKIKEEEMLEHMHMIANVISRSLQQDLCSL